MKQLAIVFALLTILVSANARDAAGTCITVDDKNSPTVTLSGRVTKHHNALPKHSELRAAEGIYLKLYTRLRANIGAGCADLDEIVVMEPDNQQPIQIERWNNRHVVVVGKLGRFGSALVHPPIFIEISTIKGR